MPKQKTKPHYLCCNADESEPGTFKDREIMRWTPHALIEGCAIAAYAIQAETAFIYIRGEFTEPIAVMQTALDEAYARGVLGANAMGKGHRDRRHVHRGAGAYICGEETALMNSHRGQARQPAHQAAVPRRVGRLRPAHDDQQRRDARPAVPHIVNRGAAWYKGLCLSNPEEHGHQAVLGLRHRREARQLRSRRWASRSRSCCSTSAGGMLPGRTLKAVIPGGSSVPILTAAEAEDTLLDYEGCVAKGTMLGSGGMIVLDDSVDMVYQVMRLAQFYAHESCAQCTQCREGTAWTVKILQRMLGGQGKKEDLDLLLDLSEQHDRQDHLRAVRFVRRAGRERDQEVPARVREVPAATAGRSAHERPRQAHDRGP